MERAWIHRLARAPTKHARLRLRQAIDLGKHVYEADARELTSGFTPPPEACNTWRNLYARLADFDGALRRHIHLENFVLFPRALGE